MLKIEDAIFLIDNWASNVGPRYRAVCDLTVKGRYSLDSFMMELVECVEHALHSIQRQLSVRLQMEWVI